MAVCFLDWDELDTACFRSVAFVGYFRSSEVLALVGKDALRPAKNVANAYKHWGVVICPQSKQPPPKPTHATTAFYLTLPTEVRRRNWSIFSGVNAMVTSRSSEFPWYELCGWHRSRCATVRRQPTATQMCGFL